MFHIKIRYSRAQQGLQKVVGIVYGDWESSYAELPKYLYVVQNNNPELYIMLFTSVMFLMVLFGLLDRQLIVSHIIVMYFLTTTLICVESTQVRYGTCSYWCRRRSRSFSISIFYCAGRVLTDMELVCSLYVELYFFLTSWCIIFISDRMKEILRVLNEAWHI